MLPPEQVAVTDAAGRVLAEPVLLPTMPASPVAAIDGHAVRADETEGASDYAPLAIGGAPVAAGMPLPPGTDAVLPPAMFETGPVALAAVARGNFVVPSGHDAPAGASLPAGTQLRPLHLALLSLAGHASVAAVRRPRVTIEAGALTAMLAALAAAEGAVVTDNKADLVLAVSGSKARMSDMPYAFGIEASGILRLDLPGDPPACATLFATLVAPTLRRMGGRPEPLPAQAILTRKITSALGQSDAVRVSVANGTATPLGPADGIGLLAAAGADGLVLIPVNSEGYPAGANVPIYPP